MQSKLGACSSARFAKYMICLQLQIDNSPRNLFTAKQARSLCTMFKAHMMVLQVRVQVSALTQLQHCCEGAAVQLKDVQ